MSVPTPPAFTLTGEQIAETFATSAFVLGLHLDGLSHADSLLQPESGGNCLNWIVGHIAVSRDHLLEAMGQEMVLGEAARATYDRESAPIVTGEEAGVLPLETLQDAIQQAGERISATLAEHGSAAMQPAPEPDAASDDGPANPAGHVLFVMMHEAFHLGQMEYLRHRAGKHEPVR